MPEMTTVIAIFGEDDEPWFYESDPDDAEGTSDRYAVEIPTAIWKAYDDAYKAYTAALRTVREAAPLDPDGAPKLATCCAEWEGHERPATVWWVVGLPTDGTGETWPARGVASLNHFDSPQEAQAYIDSLPAEFYAHYGAQPLAHVTRDRLVIERGGFGANVSECYRCGWSRDEHAIAQVA